MGIYIMNTMEAKIYIEQGFLNTVLAPSQALISFKIVSSNGIFNKVVNEYLLL